MAAGIPLEPEHVLSIVELAGLQRDTDFCIHDIQHYERALTHRSCSSLHAPVHTNERDEFLGDGLLGCIVARHVYDRMPHANEGELTRMRIKLVNGRRLAEISRLLGLDRFIRLSDQLERSGGARRRDGGDGGRDRGLSAAIMEDAFEAFVAAVYNDQRELAKQRLRALNMTPQPAATHGVRGVAADALLQLVTPDGLAFAQTERFVAGVYARFVDFSQALATETNYKDILTKHFQKHFKVPPRFELVRAEGPSNNRLFTFAVKHSNGDVLGEGQGRSKRAAHQLAAQKALERLGVPAQYE